MFVYVFTKNEADLLKSLGCLFLCEVNLDDKLAFVFEDTRMIDYSKKGIEAYKTNKLYFV